MKRPVSVHRNLKDMDAAVAGVKEYIASLELMVADKNGVIQGLETYPPPGRISLVTSRGFHAPSNEMTPETAKEKVRTWLATCEAIRDRNAPKIEANKKLYEVIHRYLVSVGLPDSEPYSPPARGRGISKTAWKPSGWVESLRNYILCADAEFASISLVAADEEKKIAAFEAKEKQKAASEVAKAKAAQEQKSANLLVLSLIVRYALSESADGRDVLDALLERNKDLRLGHHLWRVREDWSDGPDAAQHGLDGFVAETDEDRKAVTEIQGLIDDWGNDGRVFRDHRFGHDFFFAKADEALYADYLKLRDALDVLGLNP